MNIWVTLVLTLHVIAAIVVIVLVLLQHGKGADMGAAFGSGSSGSLFGASGSANFLSRATAVTAGLFFLSSLGLTYLASARYTGGDVGVMESLRPAGEAKGEKKSGDTVPGAEAAPKSGAAPQSDTVPGTSKDAAPK